MRNPNGSYAPGSLGAGCAAEPGALTIRDEVLLQWVDGQLVRPRAPRAEWWSRGVVLAPAARGLPR